MKKILSICMTAVFITFMVGVNVFGVSLISPASKSPEFLKGKLSDSLSKDIKGVHKFFNDNKNQFFVEDAANEFLELSNKSDELGYTHVKVQQVVKGIPVYGNEYIVHFNNLGQVVLVNGKFNSQARNSKIDKKAFIGENKALEIAKTQVKFDSLEIDPTVKLYIYNTNGEYVPAYEVRLNFLYPDPGDWHIFINAYNGNIVSKVNAILDVAATGTGTGVLGDTKTINLDYVNSTYYLRDVTKAMAATSGYILTYNDSNKTRLPGSLMYETSSVFNTTAEKAAVDAHYYAGAVYDFYKNSFNRNSIDGNGMSIKSTVHYGRNYNNAFWNGAQMVYGDGDGTTFTYLSGDLDVVGHEMTHGVTDSACGLIYQNQSGALNESISDVFGCLIEAYNKGTTNWTVGDEVYTPSKSGDALRSLANPKLYGQPDNMSSYVYTTSDNGGVHTNSGIPNKAAYLVAKSIGNTETAAIYYRALTVYFTSTTNFHDARLALVQAAADLYGTGSAEAAAVNNAFNTVGII